MTRAVRCGLAAFVVVGCARSHLQDRLPSDTNAPPVQSDAEPTAPSDAPGMSIEDVPPAVEEDSGTRHHEGDEQPTCDDACSECRWVALAEDCEPSLEAFMADCEAGYLCVSQACEQQCIAAWGECGKTCLPVQGTCPALWDALLICTHNTCEALCAP